MTTTFPGYALRRATERRQPTPVRFPSSQSENCSTLIHGRQRRAFVVAINVAHGTILGTVYTDDDKI